MQIAATFARASQTDLLHSEEGFAGPAAVTYASRDELFVARRGPVDGEQAT